MPANIDLLLSRLDHCKPSGKDRWQARCPAHEDKSPSLTVAIGDSGRILIHCFAGCGASDVVAAIGLSLSDLFTEPLDNHLPSLTKRPVTPINIVQEARALHQIIDAFKATGRILNRDVVEEWARNYVAIFARDREEGVPVRQEDIDLLRKIRSTVLRSQAI